MSANTFNPWMCVLEGICDRGLLGARVAWTQTSCNRETLDTFGANPSFLLVMQVDFSDAGARARLSGVSLDLAGPGVPGLKGLITYGNGRGATDSSTGPTSSITSPGSQPTTAGVLARRPAG